MSVRFNFLHLLPRHFRDVWIPSDLVLAWDPDAVLIIFCAS